MYEYTTKENCNPPSFNTRFMQHLYKNRGKKSFVINY